MSFINNIFRSTGIDSKALFNNIMTMAEEGSRAIAKYGAERLKAGAVNIQKTDFMNGRSFNIQHFTKQSNIIRTLFIAAATVVANALVKYTLGHTSKANISDPIRAKALEFGQEVSSYLRNKLDHLS